MASKEKYLIALDFDGTCTHRKDSVVPYVVARMSPEGQRRDEVSTAAFRSNGFHGAQFDHAAGAKLIKELCETMVSERLLDREMSDAVAGVKLRDGVLPFLRLMKTRGVPVVIVSFAIKQLIQTVLLRNGALDLVDCVYAASLVFDGEGRICGYDPGSPVHPATKGAVSKLAARIRGVPVRNIVAVGDSLGDVTLGGFKKNRLGVAHEPEDIPLMRPHFGEVILLKDHSFDPAAEWVRRKLGLSR